MCIHTEYGVDCDERSKKGEKGEPRNHGRPFSAGALGHSIILEVDHFDHSIPGSVYKTGPMQNIPWVRSRIWIVISTSQLQPQAAWIRSPALAILEQTLLPAARSQDNLFDLQNRVHFLVIGSKYRQSILGVRYDLVRAIELDVCLRTFFCPDRFVNHFPVWQEAMLCECWHHTCGWLAIQTTEHWGSRYG